MKDSESLLKYYREELHWNPPFAEVLGKYVPGGLEGYLTMRESVQGGELPAKYKELIFCILDSLDDEESGAEAHAVNAVDEGLSLKELTEAFMIVTIVKGINVLCKAGVKAIEAAEKEYEKLNAK